MMQSFNNALRILYFSVKSDPRLLILITVYFALFTIACITGRVVWLLLALIWCILFLLADKLMFRFRLGIDIATQNFYIYRFFGRNFIYQYRKRNGKSCEDMKRAIVFEKNTLLASLPAGRFVAITHETVIGRLMEADNVTLRRCIPAYRKNLHSIQDKMLGCKKCSRKRNCGIRRLGSKPRQFYYVEFNKKREEQPNSVR